MPAGQPEPPPAGAGPFAALDEIVQNHQRGGAQPGLAYGIVADGRLAHAGGAGESWLGGPVPDASTVFRIASMTKSFTASAILALRDDGALRLDDPAGDYVPELRSVPPVTPDSPPVSIRHLLTMTAGFPTDDPWGDRQQGLPLDEFAAFLAAGVRSAWAPGTCFEYSNMGYAILGMVITAAAGCPYPEFVQRRLLVPLGLDLTGYEASEFAVEQLARGYRSGPGGWQELVPDGCGAFAPMGGIFSCVRDMARWVSGFTTAYPPGPESGADHPPGPESGADHPPGPESGADHPLSRAARREMQLPQVAMPALPAARVLRGPAASIPRSYGFGLMIEDSPASGRIVAHSGGYPGFGSNMRWHPATGTGVIVLANSTYAPAQPLADRLLDAALRETAARDTAARESRHPAVRGLAPAPGTPWPETRDAQHVIDGLLRSWDDAIADRVFTPNVAQDQPYQERLRAAERVWQRIGPPRDGARPAEFDTPAHCRWWLHGSHGDTQVEIKLTPEPRPRVQLLAITVPPAPDGPLGRCTTTLISILNAMDSPSPHIRELPPAADPGDVLRRLRMAAAWAGQVRPGAFCGGNGETSTAVELDGETASLVMAVVLGADQRLALVDFIMRP